MNAMELIWTSNKEHTRVPQYADGEVVGFTVKYTPADEWTAEFGCFSLIVEENDGYRWSIEDDFTDRECYKVREGLEPSLERAQEAAVNGLRGILINASYGHWPTPIEEPCTLDQHLADLSASQVDVTIGGVAIAGDFYQTFKGTPDRVREALEEHEALTRVRANFGYPGGMHETAKIPGFSTWARGELNATAVEMYEEYATAATAARFKGVAEWTPPLERCSAHGYQAAACPLCGGAK